MKDYELPDWLRANSSGVYRPCRIAAEIIETALKWKGMTDSEMRLQAGEMTTQEIRTVRAVLNQILPENAESSYPQD